MPNRSEKQQHPVSAIKRPLDKIVSQPEILSNDALPAKRPTLQQTSSSNYAIPTDYNMWQQLDEQIARLFNACNLPFNIAQHPMWKEAVRMLRPGNTPPDRKEIEGKLLDQVHENPTSKMKTELSGQDVVMIQDGWSDIHNTPVITTSLH